MDYFFYKKLVNNLINVKNNCCFILISVKYCIYLHRLNLNIWNIAQ